MLELDALRGIAALGVIASHLYPDQCYWMGSFVYLFFVLSGFLITRILLKARTSVITTLKHFWIRRIIRIWPVYYATLCLCVLYTVASLQLDALPDGSWGGTLASLFFVQYLDYYVTPTQPFPPPDFLSFFGHSWTLAVEEQFYVLWPLLILALRPRLAGLVVACAAAVAAAVAARGNGIPGFVLFGVIDTLAIGALLAVLDMRRAGPAVGMRLREWGAVALVTLLAVPVVARYFDPTLRPTRFDDCFLIGAFAAVYGCIVLLLVRHAGHRLLSPLRQPALVYAGTVSYGLYMFHIPVIGAIEIVLARYGIPRAPAVDAAIWLSIVAAASASYVFLERPLGALKRRFPV